MMANKIIVFFVMLIMITTIIPFTTLAEDNTIIAEQTSTVGYYQIPYYYQCVSQLVDFEQDVHILTKVEVEFDDPPAEQDNPLLNDIIVVGISKCKSDNTDDWERNVPRSAYKCEGWEVFNFQDYEVSGNSEIYIIVKYLTLGERDGNIGVMVDNENPYPDGYVNTYNVSRGWETQSSADLAFKLYGIINFPPYVPYIDGPEEAVVGTEYDYTIYANDENEDYDLQYNIDWGNGWTGWEDFTNEEYNENDECTSASETVSHTWNSEYSGLIKVKIRDRFGVECDGTGSIYVDIVEVNPDPSVSLSPSSHSFGDVEVDSCSSSFSFTLKNDGGGTATGSVSLGGSNPDQFEFVDDTGGDFSLDAGSSKPVKVRFCPGSEGGKSADIEVDCDNCDDVSCSLSGTGVDSDVSPICSISASPSSGEVPLDTTFTISASDSDGSVDSWELDVDNDGSCDYSGSGSPPSSIPHTYSSAGEYTAVLKVWDDEGNSGSDSCSVVVNPGNRAPNKPVCDYPSNNARDISLTADLEWTCSDPDGDDLKFDIYFGRTRNPIKRETNFEMDPSDDVFKYDPGDLDFNKDYYWKIVARDSSGLETEGDIWHFHTQRNQDPQDGRWGLIVAPFTNDDAYEGVKGHIDDIEATFEANGWNNVFTLEDCKYGEFKDYFEDGGKLRENVKAGNKVIIWFLSHGLNMFGGEIAFRNVFGWDYNPAFIGQWKKYSDINSCINKLNSEADISIVLNACYSGSAIDDFRGSNRVVVTVANSNEEGKGMHFSKDLLQGFKGFTDLDTDKYNGNDDGIVSIEEAFSYAKENKVDGTHPQIYDGNGNSDMGLVDVPFYGNLREYQEYGSTPKTIQENDDWYAQSFTASFEVLTEVYLNMFVSGEFDSSTFEVSIRKADMDDSGKPGEIIHSQTMTFTNEGDSYEWWDKPILINGGEGVSVERDQTYFIVVNSINGEINWNGIKSDMYSGGEAYKSFDGDNWNDDCILDDFSFYVFGNVNVVSKDKLQDFPFLSFVRNNIMLPFFRLLGEIPFFQKLDSMMDLPILK